MILAALILSSLAVNVFCENNHIGNHLNKNYNDKLENENFAKGKDTFYPSADQLTGSTEDSGSLYEIDEAKIYKVFKEFDSIDRNLIKAKKVLYSENDDSNLKMAKIGEEENSDEAEFQWKVTGNPDLAEDPADKLNFIESKLYDETQSQNVEYDAKRMETHDHLDNFLTTNEKSATVTLITENGKDKTENHLKTIRKYKEEIVIDPKSDLKSKLEEDSNKDTSNPDIKNNLKELFSEPSQQNKKMYPDEKYDVLNSTKASKEKNMGHGSKLLQRHIHDFKKNLSACLKEVQIADTAPVKVLSPRFESPIHANCLVACVLRKNNIIDGFSIDRENLISLVLKFYEKNSKAVKRLTKNINKCIDLAKKYKNQCDVAAVLNSCTNDVMAHMKS